jgi:hypothetical protein
VRLFCDFIAIFLVLARDKMIVSNKLNDPFIVKLSIFRRFLHYPYKSTGDWPALFLLRKKTASAGGDGVTKTNVYDTSFR